MTNRGAASAKKGVRRWRRRVAVAALLGLMVLVIGGGVAYWRFLTPERLARYAERTLSRMIGAEVSIAGGRLDWPAGIVLHEVRIRVPGVEAEAGELLEADRLELRFNRSALWAGRVEPEQIELISPRFHVCEMVDDQRFTFQLLEPEEQAVAGPPTLPRVRIADGTLVSGEVQDGRYLRLGALPFDGRLTQDSTNPDVLHLMFRERRVAGQGGPDQGDADPASPAGDRGLSIEGMVSIDGLTAQGTLRGLAFEPRFRQLLPRQVREYWAQMAPHGAFETVRFATDPRRGWRVQVAFDSVGLRLPLPAIEEQAEPLAMTDVNGAIRFEPNRIAIDEELVGEVAGIQYRVNGSIEGYDDQSPFRFSVHTDAFDVPEAPDYIYALPRPVREGFDMLAPTGRLRVSMAAWREQRGGRLNYEGTATVLEGRGRYYRFPYELTNCRGKVKFSRDAIRVMNLTGRTSGGGSATITGTIAPPGDTAAVDLTITAVDLPFDDTLREALQPRHRPALDMFFNKPAFQTLVEQGHILPFDRYNALESRASALRRRIAELDRNATGDSEDPDAAPATAIDAGPDAGPDAGTDNGGDAPAKSKRDELAAELAEVRRQLQTPAFDLGGRADVVVHVTRPEGEGDLTEETTTVHLKQANIIFEYFPYPLEINRGVLRIQKGLIELEGVEAAGLFGGRGELAGKVEIPSSDEPDAPLRPEVRVLASDLPLDATLISALPDPQNRWLRQLHPEGEIDVAGRIVTNDRDEPDVAMRVVFEGVTARPSEKMKLTDLAGEARLSLHHAEVTRLTGRFGEARLAITGDAAWRDAEKTTMDFDAKLEGMSFDEPIIDIARPFIEVDPRWQKAIDQYQPRGRFDAVLHYVQRGGEEPAMSLAVSPQTLSMVYDEKRVEIDQPKGRLIIEPQRIGVDKLSGRVGEATFELDGSVSLASPLTADLKLELEADALDEALARLLPEAWRSALNSASFAGGFALSLDTLTVRPEAEEGQTKYAASGRLKLDDGRFDLGLPVRSFKGELALSAVQRAGEDRPAVEIALDAEHAIVADRKITDIEGALGRPADADQPLQVQKMRGRLYGGAVTAKGTVDLDTKRFAMHFNLAEVDLRRFHERDNSAPTEARGNEQPKPADATAGDGVSGDSASVDEGASDDAPHRNDGEGDGEREAKPQMKGRLAAAFDVQGHIDKLDAVQARGKLRIDQATLYNLPLSMGLLQVTHLAMPVARSFSKAQIDYYLKDGQITFDRIALDSPSLRMAGKGSLDPDTGELDLTLTSSNPSAIKLGPLTEVIDGIRDQLVTVHITGTLEEPRTQVRQLNGLTEAWRDVFGRDDASSN